MKWCLDLSVFVFVLVFVYVDITAAKRYNYCSEGCCPHEFCAYHKICYPTLHCHVTCPDGHCDNGLCMPSKPCTDNKECEMSHTCTNNYNLGYKTCQYNLDIGKTLCVDRYGKSVMWKEGS